MRYLNYTGDKSLGPYTCPCTCTVRAPQPFLCSIKQGTFWFDGQVFGLFVCRHKVSYSYVSATYSENNDLCGFLRLFILWEVRFFAAQPLHYFAHYFTSKYVPPCILLSKHRSAGDECSVFHEGESRRRQVRPCSFENDRCRAVLKYITSRRQREFCPVYRPSNWT